MKQPLILDIKGNSLDDGPGIRSAVFFKGCPLKCIWCHNPESKNVLPEISFDAQSCIGCGKCRKVCGQNALDVAFPGYIDRDKCNLCYKCADVCPAKAVTRVGNSIDMDQLLQKLLKDKPFYDVSGGGVTLSGGEATMYAEWVGELARRLHDSGVKVLVETCGMFEYDRIAANMLPWISDIYCDIKFYDRESHLKYCGAYNDRILENIRRLQEEREKYGYTLLPRVPLIPGITDTDENLAAIADFMQKTGFTRTSLLPYNPTWYGKNDKLGITLAKELQGVSGWQSKEQMAHMKNIFKTKNIDC